MAGCVSDEVEDDNILHSNQQGLSAQGPQQRSGAEGVDTLRPSRDELLAELEVITDANTGGAVLNLTIEQAITRALARSPEIMVVSFEPDISKEEIAKAAAEFDYTAFGRINYGKDDRPTNSITNMDIGQTRTRLWEAGVKQKGVTGSEWSLGWALTRKWDDLTTRVLSTRYEPMLTFQLRQPLLRNAWEEVNLAGVNISRLNYEIALTAFRQKTEEIAVKVISTYWLLLQSRRELEIQQWLFDKTVETLKKVEDRREIDATDVQVKQAEAYVETRRAVLFQAKKRIIDVQDALMRLLSDPQMNVLSEVKIVPATVPNTEAKRIETSDALQLAMKNNPAIQQRQLGIAVAQINIDVAQNQRMPRLDLVASAGLQGFAKNASNAQDRLYDGDYTSYGIGLSLEYPLGNRQRKAELRRRQLEHSQAIWTLQDISDEVATQVKERIREVETTHQEMQAQAAAVRAAKIHLQAVEDTEPIRARLTPEFLLVKLQGQETLASARRAEIKAVVDFNNAIAGLAQATGTVLELHHVQTALNELTIDN